MESNKEIADRISRDTGSGYWKVNDQYFFNKAECLRYATSLNTHAVSYHFFDEVFAKLDLIA